MRLAESATLSLFFLIGGVAEAQSAWVQPEGQSFLQVSLQQIGPYDELFQERGADFITGREITQTTLETYGEVGLTRDLTLIGTLPIHFLDAGSLSANPSLTPVTIDSGSQAELGNLALGLRRQLSRGPYALAAQVQLELPTSSDPGADGLRAGLDAFSLLPSLSVGRGFGQSYAQAYLGLGLRDNGYADDWRLGVESGYRLGRFQFAGNIDLVSTLSSGEVELDPRQAQTGLYVDETEYLAYGIKGSYELSPGYWLHAAARFASSGNHVAKSPFLTVGLAMSW